MKDCDGLSGIWKLKSQSYFVISIPILVTSHTFFWIKYVTLFHSHFPEKANVQAITLLSRDVGKVEINEENLISEDPWALCLWLKLKGSDHWQNRNG